MDTTHLRSEPSRRRHPSQTNRLQDSFPPQLTVAIALENSQYQFSASNAPANFFFGNPGALGGLNNSSANYTNKVATDVLVKATYEPGFGHYEIGSGVG